MKNRDIEFYENKLLSGNYESDIGYFKEIFKNDSILRVRELRIAGTGTRCTLLFFDGMADSDAVTNGIIRSLLTASAEKNVSVTPRYITETFLYSSEVCETANATDILRGILYGDTAMFVENSKTALVINTKGWKTRGIAEPPNERVKAGPREGFEEAALLNVAEIRRKLQTPDLCVESLKLGRRTDTQVFICYLGSLADGGLLKELRKRISEIDIDGILDTNYIAEEITDRKHCLFKTVGSTERPDVVAARLLEGRVAVIADGTPVVITVPYLFSENFQSDEDYYIGFLSGSIGRLLRIASFIVAAFAPALFIALCTFHGGLLPTSLALSVMRLRTGVPASSLSECIMLILCFEVLKEASARAMQEWGVALSIVGGLVIGQAAVDTRVVSAPVLIIVALAGVCSVTVPRLRSAIFCIKMLTVILSGFFGFLGLFASVTAVLLYVLNLTSFGADYTESLVRPRKSSFKDTFYRTGWSKMIMRPIFNKKDKVRQKDEK